MELGSVATVGHSETQAAACQRNAATAYTANYHQVKGRRRLCVERATGDVALTNSLGRCWRGVVQGARGAVDDIAR